MTLPDGSRRTVPLVGDTVSLGRSGNNDLSCPEDSGLSRQHMVFERDGGDWSVRDLGSKNGTLLNDARLTEAVRLNAGDRIVASRVTLIFDGSIEERPVPEGTVIFDATQAISSRPPTHTITLGDLLPEREQMTGEPAGSCQPMGGSRESVVARRPRVGGEEAREKSV